MCLRVARFALVILWISVLSLAPGAETAQPTLAAGPTCTVNPSPSGGADYTTIQDAVADTGCTTISVAAGTYAGPITIGRSLTLIGAGVSSTILDGADADRVLHIDSGTVTISGVTIRNGHPHPGDGGGIENYGTLTLNSSAVISNTAEGDSIGSFGWGGAVFSTGPLTINNTTISNNTTNGSTGGIYATGPLTVISSTVSGNWSGGMHTDGSLVVNNSTISGNAGVGISSRSNATLTNTTISGTTSVNGFGGAGIAAESPGSPVTVSLANATISGNVVGVSNASLATLLITNTTIISNSMGVSNNGTVSIKNTIVAYNGSPNCTNSGAWASNGHNLSSDSTCGFTDPTDKPGVDPLAGPLANNGGTTKTHALLPGSPAIDAGANASCPAADQRGVVRPIDGDQNGTAICDIGAYEYQPRLAIFGVSPTTATVGGAAFTLTVTGTLFASGAKVQWNGANLPTTFVSSTRLSAQVGAAQLASGGFIPVRVVNPDNSVSNTVSFALNNRVPAIASVSPTLIATGTPTLTIAVTGTNFVGSSVVRWNDEARPTTFVSATRLKAQISAADLATVQQANVTVANPVPGGGSSNEATVDVGIAYAGSSGGGVPTVAISGTLAYIGEGSQLTVLNVGNPAAPVRLGGFTTREAVQDVEVVGKRAYISAAHDGLLILDVSNPAQPKLLGSYNTPWHAYDVQVVGDVAYIAAERAGLQIVDVSNPAAPKLLSTYDVTVYDLSVVNGVVYMATGNQSDDPFVSVDVHDPTHPKLRDDYFSGYPLLGATKGVQVVGTKAYIVCGDSLLIFDVSTPAIGSPGNNGAYDFHDSVKDVYVVANRAYVTSYAGKLYVLDVGDWTNPQLLSSYDTLGNSWDVRVVGNRAYVADGVGGLLILNASNSNNLTKLGVYATWSAYNQTIVGQRAYIAGGVTGMQILDITNPAAPAHLGRFTPTGSTADVEVANNVAFIANAEIWNGTTVISGGLQIVNVANPAAPALLGNYALESVEDVQVVGDRAYLAAYGGLYILKVSDPAHPLLLGKFTSPQVPSFHKLQVVGNRVYAVADMGIDRGVAVIDVSNPASPKLLGSFITIMGNATDLQVVGSVAYVTDRSGSLSGLSVSDPAHISELGSYGHYYESAWSVHVVGSLAFIAASEDNAGDLEIVDVSNPAKLKAVGSRHLAWGARGVRVVGNFVYIAADQGGLQIMRFPVPFRVYLPSMRK